MPKSKTQLRRRSVRASRKTPCKHGVKKDGGCKKKPGRKKSM